MAAIGLGLAIVDGLVRRDPFLDVRLFRNREFASAALVSLLTGYAFATAIVGAAVFVDRVLYGGPAEQQVVLGALAAATAVGALVSGFAVRRLSLRLVTLAGLAASAAALAAMAAWTPATTVSAAGLSAALFGLGFGLTVTPRSTAAVEAAGRAAFGMASATVTVARMIGMAIGLAVLTAYGSTTIDRLSAQIYATADAYKQFIPAELRGRPLRDGLVVAALERWASGEAARIMVGLFLVAAVVVIAAALPALALGGRRARMLAGDRPAARTGDAGDAGRPDGRTPSDRWRRHGADPRPLNGGPTSPRDSPCEAITRRSARTTVPSGSAVRTGSTVSRGDGLDAIPRPLPPDGVVWIDVSGPSSDQVAEITGHARAPRAHRRGHPRGQPAGQDRGHRRPHPHRHVRPRVRRSDRPERDRHRPRARASC